ncbi:MAG: hypothetical protein H5T61_10535 [Thermoflexales bacterium]|nr:hypothetical protein [Thermoflexales bacterium]
MGRFEDEYMDVLQNIEFVLVATYRNHPEMTDWDAMEAVKGLVRTYKAERDGRPAPPLRLGPLAQEAYDAVQEMCEWRLGRRPLEMRQGKERKELFLKPGEGAITRDEVILCLQRVLKSIERWNKQLGQRGYFDFVSQFVR